MDGTFRWRRAFVPCLLLLFFVAGVVASVVLYGYGCKEVRRGYLRAAKAAAASFDPDDIAKLTGTPQDTGTPVYEQARAKLRRLRVANPDSRFIYLMGLRHKEVVFLADAEPSDSPDFSAPGDPYEEATPELLQALVSGEPFIEGPMSDRWGVWVTSLAPIRDKQTGAVLCLVGWDWNARTWRLQTGVYLWPGLALTTFSVLLLAAVYGGYLRIDQINRMLTAETAERRRAQEELQRLAQQDALTGLGNRRTFDSLLDLEWRRALRAQTPISLIMLDVDHFKGYNDRYGHQAGDEALQRVADCIHRAARRAGDGACRYGGEEFVVVLPGADEDGARRVAELVRANVEAANIPHDHSSVSDRLTTSLGVVTAIPTPEDTPAAFVARADQALYHAKRMGRNRFVIAPSAANGAHAPLTDGEAAPA